MPDSAEVHYAIARLGQAIGDVEGATIAMKQVTELNDRKMRVTQAISFSNQGLDLAARGDFQGAVRALRQSAETKPDLAVAHYNLGLLLAHTGDLNAAVSELEKAISLEPARAKSHYNLGRMFASKGEFDRAIAHVQRAALLSPGDTAVVGYLQVLLADRVRRINAQKPAEVTTEASPKHQSSAGLLLVPAVGADAEPDTAENHNQAGVAFSAKGDLLGAIGEFMRALNLKQTFVDARFNLAIAHRRYGNRVVSMLELYKVIALQPDHASAHFVLGLILQEDRDLTGAIREFEQALAYKPDFPAAGHQLTLARQEAAQHLH